MYSIPPEASAAVSQSPHTISSLLPAQNLECSQSKLVGEASPRCTCLQLLYRHFVQHHPCKTALHQEPHTASRRTSPIPKQAQDATLGPAFPRRRGGEKTRSRRAAIAQPHIRTIHYCLSLRVQMTAYLTRLFQSCDSRPIGKGAKC